MPTSAYPGHYPRPLLLRQSSSWLHWVEPTRILRVSPAYCTRATQEFPRSEQSFGAVLGLYSTPSYFCVRMSQHEKTAHLCESPCTALIFRFVRFGPGFPIRVSLSCSYDASIAHFLRSHDSQLAESLHRICSLSAFWPAFPIDVQSLQEGQCYRTLTLSVRDCTSRRLLSYQGIAACHPSPVSLRFRMNGSHFHRTSIPEFTENIKNELCEALRQFLPVLESRGLIGAFVERNISYATTTSRKAT